MDVGSCGVRDGEDDHGSNCCNSDHDVDDVSSGCCSGFDSTDTDHHDINDDFNENNSNNDNNNIL